MAENIPDCLFRVWSDQSNGTNSQKLFMPAAAQNDIANAGCTPESLDRFHEHLQAALRGAHAKDIRFVFFTSSLLFALQHASWKKARGETNVYITCVHTKTAKTPQDGPVAFYAVQALLQKLNIETRKLRDGSPRYQDEYVTMASATLGADSCYVKFESLISNGLFKLYPELCEVNDRDRVRWYSAIRKLRRYGFATQRSLTKENIDSAVRLAFTFRACAADEVTNSDDTLQHLLAWLLALQKRSKADPVLTGWLETHSSLIIDLTTPGVEERMTDTSAPEFAQYSELVELFEEKSIHWGRIHTTSAISPATIERAKAEWRAWDIDERDEGRANRAKRGRYRHGRRRQDRSSSPERRRWGGKGAYRWRERR